MHNLRALTLFLFIKLFLLFYLGSVQCYINDESLQPINIYYFEPPIEKLLKVTESPNKLKSMTCEDLDVDQSCLVIQSNINKKVKFLYGSMECDQCALQDRLTIEPNGVKSFIVKFASLGSVWQIVDEKNKTICSQEEHYLGENSRYTIQVNDTHCSLICDQDAEAIYLPIIYAVVFYVLLALLWITGKYLKRREVFNFLLRSNSMDVNADIVNAYSVNSSEERKRAAQKRLRALDTVRG